MIFNLLLTSLLIYLVWFLYKYLIGSKNRIVTFGNTKLSMILKECELLKSYPQHLFLPEGHLMTIIPTLFRSLPKLTFDRELIETEEGGEISLDWMVDSMGSNEDTPVLILFPGLTGSIEANYILHFCTHQKKLGTKIVVYTSRGCGSTKLKSTQMFCGSYTEDIKRVVSHLKKRYPNSKFIGVSYSLGANIMVKYLGEEGENSGLDLAVSLANPLDMHESGLNLKTKFLQKYIYSPGMNTGLVSYVKRHEEQFKKMKKINLDMIYKSKSVYEFDSLVVAKLFNYDSAEHYYRDASSSRFLKDVKTPLLIINALDDPIVPPSAIKIVENPNIAYVITEKGGHVGWLSSFSLNDSWADHAVVEFINKMIK